MKKEIKEVDKEVNEEIVEIIDEKEEKEENLLNLQKPVILEENYQITRKQSDEVKALVREIDVNNSASILNFGSKPAEELSRISNGILSSSKNVENIEATKIIKNLSKLIEKVDISEFEKPPKKEGGFLSKIFNRGKNFLEKYENMNKEIETITQELMNYKVSLEKDQDEII